MLIKLMLGVRHFKGEPFKKMQLIYEQLSTGQNPSVLFTACSDSRVVPTYFTQSQPGDLFSIRNVGNIIPPPETPSSEAAAIEYALKVLTVTDIIICGHTDCGAMKGLLKGVSSETLPAVSLWLEHSQSVVKDMRSHHGDVTGLQQLELATKKNILTQLEHLKKYPIVAEKLKKKELNLHGWFYDIEKGEILVYDLTGKDFIPFEMACQKSINERAQTIVKTVATEFLSAYAQPQTAEGYVAMSKLLSKLEGNLDPIWNQIQTNLTAHLWETLGGLYASATDPEFIKLIDQCRITKLDSLKALQAQLQSSPGYQQFCNRFIVQNGFLKSTSLERESGQTSSMHLRSKL